jgi:SAM-dependent methyltransferase
VTGLSDSRSFEFSAQYYDLIYKDKDYERETDFLETIFSRYGKPKSVLEVGCGTGNYTKILSSRGYKVTGLDISESMLSVAKRKCDCDFVLGDVCDVSLNKKFDACIALFAVLGYIVENAKIAQALCNIRSHLKSNGLFVFDVWNGLAVMHTLPEERVKEIENGEVKIVRFAYPKLKASDHLCEVDYKFVINEKGLTQSSTREEKHIVRFFFPKEIEYYLEKSGMKVLKLCPFLDLNGKLTEDVWNMTVIAQAV